MNDGTRKGPIKLSGLLTAGGLPTADDRVVDRMAQLTPAANIVAAAESERAAGGAAIVGAGKSTTTVMPSTADTAGTIIAVDLDAIDRSPFQPRLQIEAAALAALATSIEAGDQIEPIKLRRKSDGRFELIAGERRWLAHKELGRSTIRAEVVDVDDRTAALMAGTDNTARENLNDYELGKYFQMLLEHKFVRNVAEIVRNVTISRGQVDRCLDYAKLPKDVLGMLEEKPTLFGATTAEIFAKHCAEGRVASVIEAAIMLRDRGVTEQQAIAWITRLAEAAQKGVRAPKESMPIRMADGVTLGEARAERTKIVISCAKGTKPTDLLQTIVAALQNSR
jgi:ParB family chromosome partitioning protein